MTMRSLVIAAAIVGLAGCSEPSPVPAAFRVSSIVPSSGPPAGATAVRVNGSGFRQGATLSMGGVQVAATVESPNLITAVTPAHDAGRVQVVVTNPGGATAELASGYTYAVPPPPLPVALEVTGNTILASVGDTSQLTATATYPDQSTRDVSAQSVWQVIVGQSVIAVSSEGLLTARSLGFAIISVRHPISGSSPFFRNLNISVTPPGTVVLAGRTREPGAGSLGSVLIRHLATGQTVTTAADGSYTFAAVTGTRLSFTRTDFEPVEIDAVPYEYFDVPMQRVYRLRPGESSTQLLAPNDMIYEVSPGEPRCDPCHLVRLVSPSAGRITLQVTWTDNGPPINIWAAGQRFLGTAASRQATAEFDVNSGETLVYVGRLVSGTYFQHTSMIVTAAAVN